MRHRISTRSPHSLLFILLLIVISPLFCAGQQRATPAPGRDSVIAAAREIIGAQQYCALVTIDSSGHPRARTVNPFPPDSDMVVWIATSTRTGKVREIRNDSRVCLYYADHSQATGYVSIMGKAMLVTENSEKLKRKRAYWDQAFPDWSLLVLIKVIPERMEVINYKRGMLNDPLTWAAPSVRFGAQ